MNFVRYSILSTITVNDMIDCAIINDAWHYNAASFIEFVARIVEYEKSESVLIMNNDAIHKSQEVHDIIKSRCPRFCAFLYTFHNNELYYKDFQLVFPSAHSLDLNSIELAYSLLNKQKLQYIDLKEGEETFI